MRLIITIAMISFLAMDLKGQCNKIDFVNTSLGYAYNKARAEDKSIFVFLYELGDNKASFIESAIFYKSEICQPFNDNFINIKARTNSQVGMEVIRQFQIKEFPSFVILDKNRRLIEKASNIKTSNDLLRLAKKAYE